jgi:chemotaxis receptor (MCP) glutamine deamidase CheD
MTDVSKLHCMLQDRQRQQKPDVDAAYAKQTLANVISRLRQRGCWAEARPL